MNPQQEGNGRQALERFARDLIELARKGGIDPVIGRDEEIRRVLQILSRRTKNNPVLVGEPGVGKTAVSEKNSRFRNKRAGFGFKRPDFGNNA